MKILPRLINLKIFPFIVNKLIIIIILIVKFNLSYNIAPEFADHLSTFRNLMMEKFKWQSVYQYFITQK